MVEKFSKGKEKCSGADFKAFLTWDISSSPLQLMPGWTHCKEIVGRSSNLLLGSTSSVHLTNCQLRSGKKASVLTQIFLGEVGSRIKFWAIFDWVSKVIQDYISYGRIGPYFPWQLLFWLRKKLLQKLVLENRVRGDCTGARGREEIREKRKVRDARGKCAENGVKVR